MDKSRFGDRVRRVYRSVALRPLVAALLAAGTAGSCARERVAEQRERSVVVYCSADKEFAEPIFRAYESRSGVKVLPLYDTEETKTAGLTARLVAERQSPRADVFWSSDTSRALALLAQDVADPYIPRTAGEIPNRYKAADGKWTGFAGRIRVLLYNTSRVKADEVPRSIRDLAAPRWKGRVAMANPHFGTTSFHVAALMVKWGDAAATDFLQRLKANDLVIAAGNADVKDRVSDGRVDVGLMDEDDAVVAIRDKKPVAMAILDQEGPEALGTPLMPNVALLIRNAPHADEARRFVDFLVSADTEKMLAESDAAQFPLHPGVPAPTLLPALPSIRVMDLDYLEVARRLPDMDAAARTIFGL